MFEITLAWLKKKFFSNKVWVWQDRCGCCGYDCSSQPTEEDSHNGRFWETRTCPECGTTNLVDYQHVIQRD